MKAEQNIFESISCLDDEDLVEKAYGGLIATIDLVAFDKKTNFIEVDTINSYRGKDNDIFTPILDGIYIPGSKRCYWAGFVDPVDFPLPDTGCVYITPRYRNVSFEFISIKRINSFPKKVIYSHKKPKYIYKTINTFIFKDSLQKPFVETSYYGIDNDGSVYSSIDKLKLREASSYGFELLKILNREKQNANNFTSGAISLLADRRYLWNIKTTEPIMDGHNINAIVNFGVEEEMVKSLVFARDNPLTKTGRKRPILHWVRSHKRRIKEKIEIDISRHLRGITEFKLGELLFEITKPLKIVHI